MKLDPQVVALGAVIVKGERLYPATSVEGEASQRHSAVEQIFRQALGQVGECRDDDYALLDGYDQNGDLIATYGIRTVRGFRFLYRKLNWRQYVHRPWNQNGEKSDA